MTRNLDTPIIDLSGNQINENGPMTVASVSVHALLTSQDGNPTPTQKADRYHLAMRLHQGGEQDLTPEELVLIKAVVGAAFLPIVVGQVFDWADK